MLFLPRFLQRQQLKRNILSPLSSIYHFSTQNPPKGRGKKQTVQQPGSQQHQNQQSFYSNNSSQNPGQQPQQQQVTSEEDDIHSRRLADAMKLVGGEEGKDLPDAEDPAGPAAAAATTTAVKEKRIQSKYTFSNISNSINVSLDDINIINIENEETFHKVPKLAHNLDKIVLKPGIYSMDAMAQLQADGGQFLRNIPQAEDIDFDRIPSYTPPSKDDLLLNFARQSQIKYVMSTSTISNVLSQIYFLFSSFRNPLFDNISSAYDEEPKKYMISQRKPTSNMIRKLDPKNGIYAFDSDNGLFESANKVLMDLGKIMERQLTLDPASFNNSLSKNAPKEAHIQLDEDHHRFMKLNKDICLRSQIDCQVTDPQTGKPFVFEIKTRAVCPIRYDLDNYQDHLDYRITNKFGIHSSFEREYYDLIRGAMLKYSFQLKIGRMDGAFIAYHNTKEIFGFEYVKTSEIERRCFGNSLFADASFVVCSKILTNLLDLVLNELANEKYEMLKIGFYSEQPSKKMVVFVELFEQQTKWEEKGNLLKPTPEIKDEYDYYTKYAKQSQQNKIFKFEYHIMPFINGIQLKSSNFSLMPGDQIEVKYKFKNLGKPNFIDYMNFLHEAYKFDTLNLDLSYSGAWLK